MAQVKSDPTNQNTSLNSARFRNTTVFLIIWRLCQETILSCTEPFLCLSKNLNKIIEKGKLTFSVSAASFSKNWTTQYANYKTKKEKKY